MISRFSVLKLLLILLCICGIGFGLAWRTLSPQRLESERMKSVEITITDALLLKHPLWVNASNSFKIYEIPNISIVGKDKIQTDVYQAIGKKIPVVIFCDPYCYSSYTAAIELRAITGSNLIFALAGGTSVLKSYEK